MRIFVLEDDRDRTDVFVKNLVGHTVVFAETALDAISKLEAYEFDLIFLDHDLGGEQMVGTQGANTGSEVVRNMVRTYQEEAWNWPTTIVHSLNTPAAEAMQRDLETIGVDVRRIPFTRLVNLLDDPGFLSL